MCRTAARATPTYHARCAQVRGSPVVSPDETGWKVAGSLHWLWAFVTADTTVYAIRPGRGFGDAATILGEEFAGVLGRYGWAPYRRFVHADHQTGLAHLLRRSRLLRIDHPRSLVAAHVHHRLQQALAQSKTLAWRSRRLLHCGLPGWGLRSSILDGAGAGQDVRNRLVPLVTRILVEWLFRPDHVDLGRPASRVPRRVLDRELVEEGIGVGAGETLDQPHVRAGRPIVGEVRYRPGEVGRLDDEGLTLPAAARIPGPLADRRWQVGAPIERDDADVVDHLVQQHHILGGLQHLHVRVVAPAGHRWAGVEADDAAYAQTVWPYLGNPPSRRRGIVVHILPGLFQRRLELLRRGSEWRKGAIRRVHDH
ncbi:MAG: transposase [Luteitalea sp.]|nr:transposase [Luteitalea sp.]